MIGPGEGVSNACFLGDTALLEPVEEVVWESVISNRNFPGRGPPSEDVSVFCGSVRIEQPGQDLGQSLPYLQKGVCSRLFRHRHGDVIGSRTLSALHLPFVSIAHSCR